MNDVKITDVRIIVQGGDLYLTPTHKYMPLEIPEWAVAALRAHFAAEQPATPTPSTEQIAEAWSLIEQARKSLEPRELMWEPVRPHLVRRLAEALAALVSPVSEQPTTACTECFAEGGAHRFDCIRRSEQPTPLDPEPKRLDPKPWTCEGGLCRSARRTDHESVWSPAPGREQDRARYEQGSD